MFWNKNPITLIQCRTGVHYAELFLDFNLTVPVYFNGHIVLPGSMEVESDRRIYKAYDKYRRIFLVYLSPEEGFQYIFLKEHINVRS